MRTLALAILAAALALLAFSMPAKAASFDCAKANKPSEKLICETPDLSKKDEALAAAYEAARDRLSPAGRTRLLESQRSWLAAWPILCFEAKDGALTGVQHPLSSDPAACASAFYDARIEELKKATPKVGPYRFAITQTYLVGELGGISYSATPLLQVDAPVTPETDAFNAAMRAWGKKQNTFYSGSDDETESDAILSVYNATESFIGVETSYYAYGRGAAHGNYDTTYLNYALKRQHWITADDLFAPNADWAAPLAAEMQEQVVAKLGGDANALFSPVAPKQVADPAYWSFDTEGMTVTFGLYSIGPYAMGIQTGTASWDFLEPYLSSTALGPSDF